MLVHHKQLPSIVRETRHVTELRLEPRAHASGPSARLSAGQDIARALVLGDLRKGPVRPPTRCSTLRGGRASGDRENAMSIGNSRRIPMDTNERPPSSG